MICIPFHTWKYESFDNKPLIDDNGNVIGWSWKVRKTCKNCEKVTVDKRFMHNDSD